MKDCVLFESATFDINSAADKATFYAGAISGEVVAIEIIPLSTDAGGATIKFDKVQHDGTRGDGDVGEITVPAADSQYNGLIEFKNGVSFVGGERIVVQVTAESVSACADARARIWFRPTGQYPGENSNVAEA